MKAILINLILLILIIDVCKSEDKSPLSRQDFNFTIEFYPSFIEPCRIILQKKGDIESLSIDNRKFMGDTEFLKHIENVSVTLKDFQQFKDSLIKIDLTKQKSLNKEGILDGIMVYFRFKSDSVDHHFNLLCPNPNDANEFKIIKAVFTIIERSFKTESALNYIESLKNYFDFGLLVKHISDNPLEYRFYGFLSSHEAKEFKGLMSSLPNDKLIIIDFSNFEGMGRMFYTDFGILISKNPNVYWLVNKYSQNQILEIGVKPDKIFNNRQELNSKIKAFH